MSIHKQATEVWRKVKGKQAGSPKSANNREDGFEQNRMLIQMLKNYNNFLPKIVRVVEGYSLKGKQKPSLTFGGTGFQFYWKLQDLVGRNIYMWMEGLPTRRGIKISVEFGIDGKTEVHDQRILNIPEGDVARLAEEIQWAYTDLAQVYRKMRSDWDWKMNH